MRFGSACLSLCALGVLLACDGREVTVFDVAGSAGAGGVAGGSGAGSGSVAGSTTDLAGAGGAATAGSASLAGGGGVGLPASGGVAGASGMPPGTACSSEAQCSPGWLCEKQGCDATTGICEPRPVFCPPEPLPVCGCDGVTYWNDCLRRQNGALLAAPGECRSTACSCDIGADCSVPYAYCSHLIQPGEMCGSGTGACWILPPQCVPGADTKLWRPCKPPDPGQPPPACVDTCMAIASEHSHVPPHRNSDDCK